MNPHILLYNLSDPGVGGLAQYNHSVLLKLIESGYRVSSIQCQHKTPLSEREKELGVRQVWLDFSSSRDLSRLLKDFETHRRLLQDLQPDLILFSDGWPFDNIAAKQVAIQLDIPFIAVIGLVKSEWSAFSSIDGVPYLDVVAYHCRQARAIVVGAQEHLDVLHRSYQLPKEKGQVIFCGRPPQYFAPPNLETRQRLRQTLGIPQDAIVCLTSARLDAVKGHRYQLEAIDQLRQTEVWSKLYFVWAGTGVGSYANTEPQLRETVRQLGVVDRVKFLGHRWDILDWLDTSDIFVLTSLAEAAPSIAAIEAMAKGIPVVASATGGIPEGLGDTGKLLPDPNVDPQGTVRVLVETLQTWAIDSSLRRSIGQACKQRAEQLFRSEPVLQATMQVIQQALEPVPPVPLSPEDIAAEQKLRYGSLVWRAWSYHCQGDQTAMATALARSLQVTPFLPVETAANWVTTFVKLSQEQGDRLDTYAIVNSPEWQSLIRTIQQTPHPLATTLSIAT